MANVAKTHHAQRWVNTFYDELRTTGETWYVGSQVTGATNSTSYGRTPEAPFATLAYAVATAANANNGDLVIVLPGHVETVTGAGGVTMSKAGVKVKGIGFGHDRPKINFTTATNASFDITAASCVVENVWFNSAIDDQTALLNISAADVTVRNCEFMLGDGSVDAEAGIVVTGAGDRLLIEDCHLYSTSTTAITNGAITCGACDNTIIRNCVITGYYATAGNIVNTATAVNFSVIGCTLTNYTADGNNKNIVYSAATTGLIARNSLAIIDSMSPLPLTAAGAWVAGNYSSSAAGVTASVLI